MKHFFGLIIGILIVVSCIKFEGYSDGGGDTGIGGINQTQILKVYANHFNIKRGDTTRITCVIKDSLDKRFIFVWQFSYGKALDVRDTTWTTQGIIKAYSSGHRNYIDWVAPTDTAGFFGITVRANNHAIDSVAVESATGVNVL